MECSVNHYLLFQPPKARVAAAVVAKVAAAAVVSGVERVRLAISARTVVDVRTVRTWPSLEDLTSCDRSARRDSATTL